MPIRYGINFPAWFNPNYPPTPPTPPKKPEPVLVEKKEVFVREYYINGMSTVSVIELLQQYVYGEFVIKMDSDSEMIYVHQILTTEVHLEEKEYNKLLKDHERKLKDHERFMAEYHARNKKYPELLLSHEDAKFRSELEKLEDETIEKQIQVSFLSQDLITASRKIEELKEKLRKLHGQGG